MKNLVLHLLLTSIFVLSVSFSTITASILDGGSVWLNIGKSNTSINIPVHYLKADGTLLLPISVSIVNNKNQILQSTESNKLTLSFPDLALKSGNYTVILEIGDFHHKVMVRL